MPNTLETMILCRIVVVLRVDGWTFEGSEFATL